MTYPETGTGYSGSYKPISDYALVGNLRTVALVARDGSIDWCCLPHLDSPGVFSALLDSERGGRFRVSLPGTSCGEQVYLEDTNILRTVFRSEQGELVLTDFMPIEGDINGSRKSHAEPEIHRILECRGGPIWAEAEWSPRFDFACAPMRLDRQSGLWLATGGGETMILSGLSDPSDAISVHVDENGFSPILRAQIRLNPGQRLALVAHFGCNRREIDIETSLAALRRTQDSWRLWAIHEGQVEKRVWAGEWKGLVTRMALACKLLTHGDTGAIAAAATTSLPEDIGGVRNWDYRFAWLRDASLVAQALVSVGHEEEAADLLFWTELTAEVCCENKLDLQIMYGLHGERELPEKVLEHLEGYRGSRPVRIGNEAAAQFQLETYGEILNAGYEMVRRGFNLNERLKIFLSSVADHVCLAWERPDFGIWEMRSGRRHFTYSKVMAWVALDRAVLLADRNGIPGNVNIWRDSRERIKRQVLEHGFNQRLGAFTQSYGSDELDAANLRLPLLEFLPFDDPRVIGTVNRTLERLTDNGLVYRYKADDGLPGKEGAFGLCTFWLVDCLAMSGRVEEAGELFESMTRRANHVGLFPEQFEPASGEFLGNFPQAFTQIGLINSSIYLAFAQGREVPEHAPIGTPAHRESLGRNGIPSDNDHT